jgi:hypothetical protein
MICPAKPVLTEDLCVVQKEDFSLTRYMCEMNTWRKAKHIHKRDKPIFSSERMLHKEYYPEGLVEKLSLVVSLKGLGAKTNWLAVNRQS